VNAALNGGVRLRDSFIALNLLNKSGREGAGNTRATLTAPTTGGSVMATHKVRPIRVEGNIAYVPLTKGYEAVIDAADMPIVGRWNWRATVLRTKVYATRGKSIGGGRSTNSSMHREIAGAEPGELVDHINGNPLDNRRSNLRRVTAAQNGWNRGPDYSNRAGLKGVSKHNFSGLWVARITANKHNHFLGYFKTPEDAHEAYKAAAIALHGRFARFA
jgi:hypothetical protein